MSDSSEKDVSPGGAPPTLTTTSQATVTVGSESQGTVGSDFIGFSYEKYTLSSSVFSSANTALVALYSKWGPGIVRIGANTVNSTTWDATGPGSRCGAAAPADVDRLAGFLTAVNWKVIYGVNGITGDIYPCGHSTAISNSPALSAAEAAYAAKSLGSRLHDFEIGNEPDLYYTGLEPSTFTYADFLTLWDSYHTAIVGVVPGAVFSGPAAASGYTPYAVPFASDRASDIVMSTEHYYFGNGSTPGWTVSVLLTPDTNLPTHYLKPLQAAVKTNNIVDGYRMDETNSFYNGGATDISGQFGTALWVIEYAFVLAQYGAEGANFHGGGAGSDCTGYNPIAFDSNGNVSAVCSEYYGMLFFSKMGPGTSMQTTVSGNAANFMSFTTVKADGTMSVALINNSSTDVVGATVTFPSSITKAQAMLLTAPSLETPSGAGITFGGASVGSDGSWSPTTVYSVPIASSKATIDVPAGSAYLVEGQ
jgi:hypothetical protein